MPAGARLYVLDAGSADTTAEIARAAGAEVESRRWRGFIDARRYALSRVATPWVLMIDADEVLDDDLRAALLAADGAGVDAYWMRRTTLFCGRPIHTAGWSNERLVRLFRSDRVRLEAHSVGGTADLHERWIPSGPAGSLPGAIVHDSYPSVASYRAKFDRYTSIEAADVRGSVLGFAVAVLLAPVKCLWSFVRYGGWRDGWRGYYVAAHSAAYPVVVQYKALRHS